MEIQETDFDEDLRHLALLAVSNCVRDTSIQNYLRGTKLLSKTGDYSDVKVVTPFGEIPWSDASRIDENEMEEYFREVLNKMYTFFQMMLNMEQPADVRERYYDLVSTSFPSHWDSPVFDKGTLDDFLSNL